jgi:hypothetical protein
MSDERDLERHIRRYLRESRDLGLQRAAFPESPLSGATGRTADRSLLRRRDPPDVDLGFDR